MVRFTPYDIRSGPKGERGLERRLGRSLCLRKPKDMPVLHAGLYARHFPREPNMSGIKPDLQAAPAAGARY